MITRWLPAYRKLIDSLCAAYAVPVGVVVGWVDKESSGNIREITSLDERGFFQLSPDESEMLGLIHERLSTDAPYSMSAGLKLIDYYRRWVRGMASAAGGLKYFVIGGEYEWRMVKLAHSMGMGATKRIFGDGVAHDSAISWDMLKGWALSQEAQYLSALHHSPSKWFVFVDEVFALGEPYGVSLPIPVGSGVG